MSEIISPMDDAERRELDMAPLDSESICAVADFLDTLIEVTPTHRSGAVSKEGISEWCEIAADYIDPDNPINPLSKLRMQLRRTDDRLMGYTYTIILDWASHYSSSDDPSYQRAYNLLVPYDLDEEDPVLSVCYQPSTVHSYMHGEELDFKLNQASYYEANTLLARNFETWNRCAYYEAEQLFKELALLAMSVKYQAA